MGKIISIIKIINKFDEVTSVLLFIPILINQVTNETILRNIESFYIKAKNEIRILLKFLVKNLKQFLLLLL